MINNLTLQSGGAAALVPSGNIEQYIARVRQIPVLAAEEELQLAQRFQDEQDLAAAQTLIVHHLKFVVYIARGFSGYGLPLGDLIQEGNIGLMKAVKRFEPSRGVRLVSFAVHWIKSEIHDFIIKNWRMVKIATTKAQRKLFFNLRSMKKRLGWLNQEEATAIAEELAVSTKDVYEMEQRIHGQDMAFHAQDEDDEESFAPEAWMNDEQANPEWQLLSEREEQRLQRRLQEGLKRLDERSRAILEARWLRENERETLHQLAERFQVSAERIRQLEQQALLQLKHSLAA